MEVHTGTALAERHEGVTVDDQPHAPEHSIEVQLPSFNASCPTNGPTCLWWSTCGPPEEVTDVLDTLCADGDILPVISADLYHYLDQVSAQQRDRQTAKAVVGRDADSIGSQDPCGAFALRGLLHWARRHDLRARLLHLARSADGPPTPIGWSDIAPSRSSPRPGQCRTSDPLPRRTRSGSLRRARTSLSRLSQERRGLPGIP